MKRGRLKGIKAGARHEAGHAVVSLACGIHVAGIVIAEGCGLTCYLSPERQDPMVECMIGWAGSLAEGVPWVNADDAAPFDKYAYTDKSLSTMRELAKELLREHAAAVDAVASALEKRRELFGPEVKKIAVKASPTLRRDAPSYPHAWKQSMLAQIDWMRGEIKKRQATLGAGT